MELNSNNPFSWGKIPKQKGVRLKLRTLKELILILLEIIFIISAYLYWFIRKRFVKGIKEKTDHQNIIILHYVQCPGGVAEEVKNLVKGIYLKGYKQILIITKDRNLKEIFSPINEYLEDVVEIKRVSKFNIKNFRKIISIIKSLGVDILHVHLEQFYGCRFIIPIAKFSNIPKIVSSELQSAGGAGGVFSLCGNPAFDVHLDQCNERNFDIVVKNWIKRKTNLLIDKVTILFDDILADYCKAFTVKSTKISVVPNCVDLDIFNLTSNNLSVKKNKKELYEKGPFIMVASSLQSSKGHYYLIKAAPKIINFFPDAKFLFFGDGLLKENLKELSYAMRLDDHIEFMGQIQDREEWVESYRNANLFVHPSLIEGMPLAILEAMAMSLPVVATSVDGNKALIEHGKNGLLVPPRDSEALADAIIELLGDFEKLMRFGEESRKRVEKYFSLNIVANKFERIYRELLNKTG